MCMGSSAPKPDRQIPQATPVAPLPDPKPATTVGGAVQSIRDRKKILEGL